MTTWIIDKYMLDRRETIGDLAQAVRDSGAQLITKEYIPFTDTKQMWPDLANPYMEHLVREVPTILYGTHGFVSKCPYKFTPGAYGITTDMNCNMYYTHIDRHSMLNGNCVFTTFGIFQQDFERFYRLFDTNKLFIRPNSGFKTFTGFAVHENDVVHELSCSMQLTSVQAETLILISPAVDIQGEFRFIIGAGEVIDGSEYRWDNILDIRHDWDHDCWKLAEKQAKQSWQPDLVYTCDVALTAKGPKIVEINSFACAGLYATDKDLVVNRINEISEKEFRGEYD